MIVERMTALVKPGRRQEAVELFKKFWTWVDAPTTHRLYTAISGQYCTIYQEVEFEDFEARAKTWATVGANPKWAQWSEKFYEIAATGTTNEFFDLVE